MVGSEEIIMAKKNPFKQKLVKEFGEMEFIDTIWKNSMSLARKTLGGKRNKFHKPYSSLALYLAREKLLEPKYKSASFYTRFEKAIGSIAERVQTAIKEEYAYRTKEFRKKYGDELVEYNGRVLTINQWFNDEFDKTIDKDDMNEIIKQFENDNERSYKDFYNNQAQNTASINGKY